MHTRLSVAAAKRWMALGKLQFIILFSRMFAPALINCYCNKFRDIRIIFPESI